MAPKESSTPRKTTSRQSKISFKPTKRDAAPIKAKAKAKATPKSKSKAKQAELSQESDAESDSSSQEVINTGNTTHLDVHDKAGRYKRYFKETRALMNNKKPIHFEDQPKVYQMLRVFDNTYEFGPCVGMTRLERWERAQALGLNPPPEVREILLTEQGQADAEIAHSVFYGRVI